LSRAFAVKYNIEKVRKILISLVIFLAVVIAILAAWIFGGCQISLFLDRLGRLK
jgi:hypothetical protein